MVKTKSSGWIFPFILLPSLLFFSSCGKIRQLQEKVEVLIGMREEDKSLPRLPHTKLIKISGQVEVIRSTHPGLPVKEGMELSKDDFIKTGPKSFALIQFGRNSQLKLFSESEMKLENLWDENHPNTYLEKEVFLFQGGTFFLHFLHPKKGGELRVKTGTAAMTIRGTKLMATLGRIRNEGEKDLKVAVLEGQVALEIIASQKEVLIGKGQGAVLNAKGEMKPPQSYDWVRSLNWNEMVTGTALENSPEIKKDIENLRPNLDL